MVVTPTPHVLSDDILARCAERAPVYDQENRFVTEDFEGLCRPSPRTRQMRCASH
jgi:hypothetical protein